MWILLIQGQSQRNHHTIYPEQDYSASSQNDNLQKKAPPLGSASLFY